MNTQRLIQYITNFPDVDGCFLADYDTNVVAKQLPPYFDEESLGEIASNCSHILDTYRAALVGCDELELNFDMKTILAKDLGSAILFTVCDKAKVTNVRIGLNIASKRYVGLNPAEEGKTPGLVSSPDTAEPAPAQESEEPPSTTTSIFGPRKKKKVSKPSEEDSGGIWG